MVFFYFAFRFWNACECRREKAFAVPSRSPGREVRCQPESCDSRNRGSAKLGPFAPPGCLQQLPVGRVPGTARLAGWLLTHPPRHRRKHAGDDDVMGPLLLPVDTRCSGPASSYPRKTPVGWERTKLMGTWRCSSAYFLCALKAICGGARRQAGIPGRLWTRKYRHCAPGGMSCLLAGAVCVRQPGVAGNLLPCLATEAAALTASGCRFAGGAGTPSTTAFP